MILKISKNYGLKYSNIEPFLIQFHQIKLWFKDANDELGFLVKIVDYFCCPRCSAVIDNYRYGHKHVCKNCNLIIVPVYLTINYMFGDYSQLYAMVWDREVLDRNKSWQHKIKKYINYVLLFWRLK